MVPIRVHRLTINDLADITNIIDDETALLTRLQCPFTVENAINFITMYNTYGVKYNKKLVGAFEIKHTGETAYVIAKDYRNKGICTESLKIAKRIAKKEYGINELWCTINRYNEASLKVAQKAGLKISYEKEILGSRY